MKNNIMVVLFFCFMLGAAFFALDAGAQTEIEQQLDGVQKTLDTVGAQVASVKEKGIIQTVLDSIAAQFKPVIDQIAVILGQIKAILVF